MSLLRGYLTASPIHARFVPYLLIVGLTFLQDSFGEDMCYWLYLVKMAVGLWCIYEMHSLVPEMRWSFSWEAVVVGVLVCVMWVGINPFYPKIEFLFKQGEPWNPIKHYGDNAAGWFFIGVRTLGSAVIVPPIEETFYRSFLYRYSVRTNFQAMPFNVFHPTAFIVVALLFGLSHYQWIAGILCGMAYQALCIRKNRLGDAMTAHAITNFLLGIWVAWKGDWQFW